MPVKAAPIGGNRQDMQMKKLFFMLFSVSVIQAPLLASYDDALSLFQKKLYKDSLAKIAAVLEVGRDMEPDSPNYKLRFLAAHNHWRLGNLEPAIAHFKRCIDIKKGSADPLIDLGLMLLEQNRYGDAEVYARKAAAIQKSALAYYIMGNASYGVGNYWRAKELLEKAIAEDPGLYVAYNCLGAALMKLKRYNQANTAFSAALAMGPPGPELHNNIGFSLELSGKLKEALGHYKKAAEMEPDNPVIRQNMARLEAKLK